MMDQIHFQPLELPFWNDKVVHTWYHFIVKAKIGIPSGVPLKSVLQCSNVIILLGSVCEGVG